jgi:hypothetical protein
VRRVAFAAALTVFYLCVSAQGQAPLEYSGDIRETDPRVQDVRAAIVAGQAPPADLRLRYSGTRDDYLAFYDLEGREVYYRYREDRFDRRAEKITRDLIAGQAYRVTGRFTGVIRDGIFVGNRSPEFAAAVAGPDSILAYEYAAAEALRLEQVLF